MDYIISEKEKAKEKETGGDEMMAEDDASVQAFLARGGVIQQLPYKKPRKADKTDFGSKHIGTGKGGKAQNVSGLGANTRVGAKPVVSVEEKIKGVDGKACWKGKRYAGKVKKADGTYKDKCVPVGEDVYTAQLLNQLETVISEKAVSKAQQKFMGMVHAVQKGEMKAPSKDVAKAAKGMSMKAGHDFAATKHKGLPDKKSKK